MFLYIFSLPEYKFKLYFSEKNLVSVLGTLSTFAVQHCTASKMWENLCAQFESKDSLVYTDLLQTIYTTRAVNGSNIVKHLAKLKQLWDQLGHMMYSEHFVLENDIAFKRVIVQSLLQSWNTFTNQFVCGPIDLVDRDPKTHIFSQQMIGMIKHKYLLIESQNKKENKAQKKGNSSSLANRMGSLSGGSLSSGSLPKKHCTHCGRDNHKKKDCKYKDMSKCKDCNLFHNGKCWQPSAKCLWKGKGKELSNKKAKELPGAGSSVHRDWHR